MTSTRTADRVGAAVRRDARRSRVAAASLALLLSAPGCCGLVSRSDATPSLGFAANAIADRAANDALTTAGAIAGVGGALEDEFRNSGSRLAATCSLYGGRD